MPPSPNQCDRRAEFDAQAEERYAKVIASDLTISWHDMREYLEARMAGKTTKMPTARKMNRVWPQWHLS